jgi:hypothetical protein
MNPYLILGAVGALLVSFLGGGFLGWHERAVRVPAELVEQQTVDTKACDQVQLLTKRANNDLQKNNGVITRKLAALRLQHPAACVPVAGASNLPAGGQQHAGQDGGSVSADTLRGYAAEAETYRSELTVCTQFLAQERKEAPAQ